MRLRLFFLGTILAGLCAPYAMAQQGINDMLAMQRNWDAYKSSDTAKPVLAMKFVPFATSKQDGKTFTSYYVYAVGLPQNKPFTLFKWQIGMGQAPQMEAVYSDLYVNARGVLMCRKPTEKEINSDAAQIDEEARLDVIAAGGMGEPIRYALVAGDNEEMSMVAMGRLVMHPIESTDKACHLQAVLATGGGEIVLLEGTGFPPKATVELSSTVKTQTAKMKTDENGRLETAAVQIKSGLTQGKVTLTMKSDACAPSVTFPWGAGSYKVQ